MHEQDRFRFTQETGQGLADRLIHLVNAKNMLLTKIMRYCGRKSKQSKRSQMQTEEVCLFICSNILSIRNVFSFRHFRRPQDLNENE